MYIYIYGKRESKEGRREERGRCIGACHTLPQITRITLWVYDDCLLVGC